MSDEVKSDKEKIGDLLDHLVKPLLSQPDAMSLNMIEASATILIEMTVNPEDHEYLSSNEMSILRAIQQLLSVASSREKKYSLELMAL